MNLDKYADVGTHSIPLNNDITYFDSLNMCLKTSENLLEIKTSKQTYLEYLEHT